MNNVGFEQVILIAMIFVGGLIVLAFFLAFLAGNNRTSYVSKRPGYLSDKERAGKKAETVVTNVIEECLYPTDCLFTNIPLVYNGVEAELDDVIVNENGVFVIEVKYYKGKLIGNEDDVSWKKMKTTNYGNIYVDDVKNPFKQLKREIHVFANYLRQFSIDVWVEGGVFLIGSNSPIQNNRLIQDTNDIHRLIHQRGRQPLSKQEIQMICEILHGYQVR